MWPQLGHASSANARAKILSTADALLMARVTATSFLFRKRMGCWIGHDVSMFDH
jgi:hypothetical protein